MPEDMTGPQDNTQRDTAPLRRDNSRIQPDRAMPAQYPNQATRAVYGPPPTPQQGAGGPSGPPPGPRRVTPLGWALRGLVLLLVAVVSGALWLAVKPSDEQAGPPEPPPLRYQFELSHREEAFHGCKQVSRGQIRSFFAEEECEHLTRALYTTELPDGSRVLTSVVTVLMPDPASAQRLNTLTTKDGTGNVRDLVEDERAGTDDMPDLDDAAYASGRQDRLVVIGDSAYMGKDTPKKDPDLTDVTNEALKLGWPQDQQKPS
ncbi:hypothetical protein GCM10009854_38170 [Saccharopolyspora halophila]|uniref:Uncharacterized protein n=2 Tax=Saccharopolyspora halophila TaxID=405551 RepID=A0ABN3GNQ3_9PSEU